MKRKEFPTFACAKAYFGPLSSFMANVKSVADGQEAGTVLEKVGKKFERIGTFIEKSDGSVTVYLDSAEQRYDGTGSQPTLGEMDEQ